MDNQKLDLSGLRGPTRATLEDFDPLIQLMDECFPRDKELGGMLPRWPHCFRKDRIQNSLIIKDGTKVVSHVGCIDQTVMLAQGEVRVAGISGVGTKPEYRRRGLMTKILLHTEDFLKQEGYAISDLGGNRQRYAHFGWEVGGRAWQFNMTARSLGAEDRPTGFEVARYSGTADEVERTLLLNRRQRIGVKRDRNTHTILLSRLGKEVFLARRRGVVEAYVVIDRQEKWAHIGEFAGIADGVHSILLHLVDSLGVESAAVPSPWSHPVNERLRAVSSGWQVNCLRNIKIIDLMATLKAFSRQISRRCRDLGLRPARTLTLGIEGESRAVKVGFSPRGTSVRPTRAGKDAIVLPRTEMVQFLFGPGSPGGVTDLPSKALFLDALLPLDFHMWPNETV